MTVGLVSTYKMASGGAFNYEAKTKPKRVLTKPSKASRNNGYDNDDNDYILCVHDILGDEEGKKFLILDMLGKGTFGQVVKCRNLKTDELVAIKVIKNSKAYYNQSMTEVTLLEMLNRQHDPHSNYAITRLKDTFVFRKHLCIIFELMSINLYELLKQNQFRGLSLKLIRVFMSQLLDAMCLLHDAKIIHCDLKPENILLVSLDSPRIKIIDFGSACHEQSTPYTYIQSRFYRSPEVIIGLPYSSSIDVWSLGCIAAELFLGLPIFPGTTEYNQLSRIVEMLGILPTYMIEKGKNGKKYFCTENQKYRLKSMEEFATEYKTNEKVSKRYFKADNLVDIIMNLPFKSKADVEVETLQRKCFCDFLSGLLNLNPIGRWSPHQAKLHPFITMQPFTEPFKPPMQILKAAVIEDNRPGYRRPRANTLSHLQVPRHLLVSSDPSTAQDPSMGTAERFHDQETAFLSEQPESPSTAARRPSMFNTLNGQQYMDIDRKENPIYPSEEYPPLPQKEGTPTAQPPFAQRLQGYLQQRRVSNPPSMLKKNENNEKSLPLFPTQMMRRGSTKQKPFESNSSPLAHLSLSASAIHNTHESTSSSDSPAQEQQ